MQRKQTDPRNLFQGFLILMLLLLGGGNIAAQTRSTRSWTSRAPWALDAIQKLHAAGILKGYPGNGFEGRRRLTQQELMCLVDRLREHLGAFQHIAAQPQLEAWIHILDFPTPQEGEDAQSMFFHLSPLERTWGLWELDPDHWAYASQNRLVKAGIVGVKLPGVRIPLSFTRSDLAFLVVQLLQRMEKPVDLRGKAFRTYRDVDAEYWSFGSILVVTALGVMEGYPDGTFRGAQGVRREELAMTLVRLLDLAGKSPSP